MLVESLLRENVINFVLGKMALDDFEDWFVASSWNMHQDSSPTAVALASAVELRLAELSSEHLSEHMLKRELSKLVSGIIMVSVHEERSSMASDSATEIKDSVGSPYDIRPEKAYAS
jgi:hypothetical protein